MVTNATYDGYRLSLVYSKWHFYWNLTNRHGPHEFVNIYPQLVDYLIAHLIATHLSTNIEKVNYFQNYQEKNNSPVHFTEALDKRLFDFILPLALLLL